jgi:pimeloyl-ACP methyl ester carboxylesterase
MRNEVDKHDIRSPTATFSETKNNESPVDGIYFSFVPNANGIRHRLASTVPNLIQDGGANARSKGHPLILFLHGFPESWYSWKNQLLFLRDRPFLPVAPDIRGYGLTSQPYSTEEYTQPVVAKDVMEIAKAIGYDQFIVVGHDWGCYTAWSVALLYPNSVLGCCGMSVPYGGTPKVDMLTMLQYKYGACLDEKVPRKIRARAKFHYMLHHCLPQSGQEYNKNARDFLYRIYTHRPGCDFEDGTPEYDIDGLMFEHATEDDESVVLDATVSPGLWKRLPRAKRLPDWLKKDDLEYITNEFERSGFHGPLCWYRAMGLNLTLMKSALTEKNGILNDKIYKPSLFIIGENDALINLYGGKGKVVSRLEMYLKNMTQPPLFIPNTGHWVQLEAKEAVNVALLQFLVSVAQTKQSTARFRSRI